MSTRTCTYHECDRRTAGHNDHYIPVLRAMNQKYGWFPIEILEQDGTKLTFSFRSPLGDETRTAYNHNPELLAQAQQFNPDWNILRFKRDGGTAYRAILLSQKPLAPCTTAV